MDRRSGSSEACQAPSPSSSSSSSSSQSSLRSRLRAALSPGRQRARHRTRWRQDAEALLASVTFPLYGLSADWQGRRYRAGHSTTVSSGQRKNPVHRFKLGHGDPLILGSPLLSVESGPRTSHGEPRELLSQKRWLYTISEHDRRTGLDNRTARALRREPDVGWRTVSIPIDGTPTDFEFLPYGGDRESDRWVAFTEIGESLLVLHGHAFPAASVALARITDLQPYVDGSRRLDAIWHRLPAEPSGD